jgi:phage shock protein A
MDLIKRIGRVVRDNLQEILGETQDPEILLERAIVQMQQHLSSLRQSLALAVATQKRTERTIAQHHTQANQWYLRAQQALTTGEEGVARSYLSRWQEYQKNAQDLLTQVETQQSAIDNLKREMHFLEHRVVTARIKKDLYITRLRSAMASQKLYQLTGEEGENLFDKVEEQILQLEAEAELASSIDTRFREIETSTSKNLVENELLKLKQQQQPETQKLGLQYSKGLTINNIEGDPEIDSLLSKIERI